MITDSLKRLQVNLQEAALKEMTQSHADDRPEDTSGCELPQASVSRSVPRQKEWWSAEDTATVEALFFEELLG